MHTALFGTVNCFHTEAHPFCAAHVQVPQEKKICSRNNVLRCSSETILLIPYYVCTYQFIDTCRFSVGNWLQLLLQSCTVTVFLLYLFNLRCGLNWVNLLDWLQLMWCFFIEWIESLYCVDHWERSCFFWLGVGDIYLAWPFIFSFLVVRYVCVGVSVSLR